MAQPLMRDARMRIARPQLVNQRRHAKWPGRGTEMHEARHAIICISIILRWHKRIAVAIGGSMRRIGLKARKRNNAASSSMALNPPCCFWYFWPSSWHLWRAPRRSVTLCV